MSKTPCRDAFHAAEHSRRAIPLSQGEYKLRELRLAIACMQNSMLAICEYLEKPRSVRPGELLGQCCTTDDKAYWIRGIPMWIADQLGRNAIPAIAALTGDGVARGHVAVELRRAREDVNRIVANCDKQHAQLKGRIAREYDAIRSGSSGVCFLLNDVDDLARRALQLNAWSESRMREALILNW
ncbi:hypothetical protein [Yoonia sp.]|uniref:hypothetical protein n=1 Tax=Yoonia sp. TaxID=2212373 RepID=UPI004048A5DD